MKNKIWKKKKDAVKQKPEQFLMHVDAALIFLHKACQLLNMDFPLHIHMSQAHESI